MNPLLTRILVSLQVAVFVSLAVALLWGAAALVSGTWQDTLSELSTRRLGLAVWLALLVGLAAGSLVGHLATLWDGR